jgi:hypothetical protein
MVLLLLLSLQRGNGTVAARSEAPLPAEVTAAIHLLTNLFCTLLLLLLLLLLLFLQRGTAAVAARDKAPLPAKVKQYTYLLKMFCVALCCCCCRFRGALAH